MKITEYPDRELLAMTVADRLASELEQAMLGHDTVTLAVPGGTTPGPIFDTLSGVHVDWSRVRVMLTDERWVPPDHARSNTALVKERLLTGHAKTAQFVPFWREGLTAGEAAAELAEDIDGHLPISVLLLGMGDDMHTASLFPGAPGVSAAMAHDAPSICAVYPENQPESRITLSAEVLAGAMSKHLVIFGEDKKAAFETAVDLPAEMAPIAAVIDGGTVHWAK